MIDIDIRDYDYDLPDDRIAMYPAEERDSSKVLYYKGGKITKDVFRNIDSFIPKDSLLVFNNTSVIKARLLFKKLSGAAIEILCLEPLKPAEYEMALGSDSPVEWNCIIGNLKKWKSGVINKEFEYNGNKITLSAEKIQPEGESWRIRFSWNSQEVSFAEVLDKVGHIPLPPYIDRDDEEEDNLRYQTIYSSIKGSVAAPTAGLHFTSDTIKSFNEKGIHLTELTLHVGAGTFKPVKSDNAMDHQMHNEHFQVSEKTIQMLIENEGRIIAVGTTSVRTLESLYWLGVKVINDQESHDKELFMDQWWPYENESSITSKDALNALLRILNQKKKKCIEASTSIMIVPGYNFRIINGMITNFHQPKSTLLLLISAWVGNDWKKIYKFASENDFRFLSYGDCSLLMR
jgi:S-adenosylmethionine:tRNA ribosyltransferase-isomerase